jgi:rubrerythrin
MKKTQSKSTKQSRQVEATPQDELLYQALETEIGGVDVYEAALKCVQNSDLREEFEEYLKQTERHVKVLRQVCTTLELDPDRETPGRKVVRHIGKSLVKAIEMAAAEGDADAAELVAVECVVLAETKDHANWELIGELSESVADEDQREALETACEEIEDEEDEHLYHSTGWARELWLQSMGLPAQLPPPEEQYDVRTQADAASVKRERMSRVSDE